MKQCTISGQLSDPWIHELNTIAREHTTMDNTTTIINRPLLQAYPHLRHNLPYTLLANLPTPVRHLQKFGSHIGLNNLYMKRDDLTGFTNNGLLAYGGNKPRKLELELAHAVALQAAQVVTFGGAGSNHALATAFYAKQLGLQSTCMLIKQINSQAVQNNLLMHYAIDSHLQHYETPLMRKIATISLWINEYNKIGKFPYLITGGGSSPLGAIGFVNAAFELKEQISQGQLPEPDYIYVVCGSCGTAAGLLLGLQATEIRSKIIAITIEPTDDQFIYKIKNLYNETNALLHTLDSSFKLYPFPEDDFVLDKNFCGLEYGMFTHEGNLAQKLMLETEHVKLDGTYTAKACAALLHHAQTQAYADKVILFWNSYCGLDFFDYIQSVKPEMLPMRLQEYFTEDIQEALL